jgi:hypothetical protein
MAIVPVHFFDTGSSVSFCTESIVRQLGGTGKHKEITLSTMGSPLKMNTYMLDGLQVYDIDMNYMIDLPSCVLSLDNGNIALGPLSDSTFLDVLTSKLQYSFLVYVVSYSMNILTAVFLTEYIDQLHKHFLVEYLFSDQCFYLS